MGRVAWDGVRVRRLSLSAFALLQRLCRAQSCIVYQQISGTYHITVAGGTREKVQPKTLEALVGPRLVTRDRASSAPAYVITDYGREVLQQQLSVRCEALGHGESCSRSECSAYTAANTDMAS
jgi:hypothetical protein